MFYWVPQFVGILVSNSMSTACHNNYQLVFSCFQGLVGIVTGGASGLGRATVERFVREGARVVICDLPKSPGQEVADKLGENAAFVPTDVKQHLLIVYKFPRLQQCCYAMILK